MASVTVTIIHHMYKRRHGVSLRLSPTHFTHHGSTINYTNLCRRELQFEIDFICTYYWTSHDKTTTTWVTLRTCCVLHLNIAFGQDEDLEEVVTIRCNCRD